MKIISKKIKSIYLLAMMAILSVCVAVFPVFKTETVKAEDLPDFRMLGAYIKVDTDLEKEDTTKCADNIAIMFQARFTETTFTTALAESNVKFGMAIGPASALASVADFSQLKEASDQGNAKIFDSLIGTTSDTKPVQLIDNETEYKYEAGIFFNKDQKDPSTGDNMYPNDFDWLGAYGVKLMAIPFYTVIGGGQDGADLVVLGAKSAEKSAVDVTLDTMLMESAKPANTTETTPNKLKRAVSDNVFKAITGYTLTRELTDDHEIYLSKTKKVFLADFGWGDTRAEMMNNIFLRYWVPSKHGTQGSGSGASMYPVGSWIAGTTIIKAFGANYNQIANVGLAAAQQRLADPTVIDNLIPGETYRGYRFDSNTNTLYYFNYIAISSAIMAQNNGSAHDMPLVQSVALTEGAGASMTGSYFALNMTKVGKAENAEFHIPAGRKSHQFDDSTGYNGYFVLGGDIIVDDPINGFQSHTPGFALTALKKFSTHSAATQAGHIPHKTIGAIKTFQQQSLAEIDFDAMAETNVGFTGVFDGRGHTISTSFGRGGVFGVINGGTVKNLNLKADYYQYLLSGSQAVYDNASYAEKSAILAEAVLDGSTIENVAIEYVPAAKSFEYHPMTIQTSAVLNGVAEMDDVTAVFAASGVYGANTKLKNVIVKCDALQYVGNSVQNYRAALNIDSAVQTENLFVIGSS